MPQYLHYKNLNGMLLQGPVLLVLVVAVVVVVATTAAVEVKEGI
jgi:hypothetical protein